MPKLMTHLVANYPNPLGFSNAVSAMFESSVDFLEIQLPFSNPLADGPLIYEANQIGLTFGQNLAEILTQVSTIYKQKNCKTKLFLMSYLTPILALGIENVVNLCGQNNFVGFIIPDLIFGSPEQKELSQLCQNNENQKMQLIPVISPLTTRIRLEKIKKELQLGQIIYAMARSGRTGNSTDLTQIQDYLDFLKENLAGFEIAIGFGIKEKSQVEFLNQQDFIAVIGSEIIRQIQTAEQNPSLIEEKIKSFLETFLDKTRPKNLEKL